MADSPDDTDAGLLLDSQTTKLCWIVGIGASAGGLRPLEEFFENLTRADNVAYVVVQHLSPDFKSLMQELLSRHTALPVCRAEDGMTIEPGSVYLIPPKKNLTISQGTLVLHPQDRGTLNFPIDLFFESMAREYAHRAIAVVLSGTGSDGSRGAVAISDVDGLVMVQAPESAEFDGMPRSAIATGVASSVLPPIELAAALHRYVVNAEALLSGHFDEQETPDLTAILEAVSAHCEVDFSCYKLPTMARRVERRRVIVGADDYNAYQDLVLKSKKERETLFADLLISVTSFFRDAEAWTRIGEEVLPKLIETLPDGEALRIWVTACASGEEAYSMAIVAKMALERMRQSRPLKIFATDVDMAALEHAGAGVFSSSVMTNVSEEIKERFFTRHEDSFRVSSDLREALIFAPQNLLRDAPFTNMHLVTCRNALIYLKARHQQVVLRTLHFSLVRGGVLFLGAAETAGELQPEFKAIDAKWVIFEKLRDAKMPLHRDLKPRTLAVGSVPRPQYLGQLKSREGALFQDAFKKIAKAKAWACLILDEHSNLLHVIGDARPYLRFPEGAVTNDVSRLLDKHLALPMTTALNRCKQQKEPVAFSGIGGDDRHYSIWANHQPAVVALPEYYVVVIEQANNVNTISATNYDADSSAAHRIAELEEQLQHTKENLQSTIEQLESTNEEQQTTNEELLAANEELQSTNEELHSVNEELYTVNSEYQAKIQELTELNNDMDNLLESTDIGVVFLDESLCARKFTPAAVRAVRLQPVDIGRRFEDVSRRFAYPRFIDDLRRVLSLAEGIDREILLDDGSYMLLRIMPYRAGSELAVGVVLSFIDITELKRVENALKQAETRYRHLFQSGLLGLAQINRENQIADANNAFLRIVGCERSSLPRAIKEFSDQSVIQWLGQARNEWESSSGERIRREYVESHSGHKVPVLLGLAPVKNPDDDAILFMIDISDQERAENMLGERTAQLERQNANLQEFAYVVSHDLSQPLRQVQGFTRLLSERFASQDGEASKFYEQILEGVGRAEALLQGVLEYSRIATRGGPLSDVDANALLKDVVTREKTRFESLQGTLTVGELPRLRADEAQLAMLFTHLLDNAFKFRSSSSPHVSICAVLGDDGWCTIDVKDNGLGLDPSRFDEASMIFRKLHRTEEQGHGVGLAICKRIVERHGGHLWAENRPGKAGTVVRFTVQGVVGANDNAPHSSSTFAAGQVHGIVRSTSPTA